GDTELLLHGDRREAHLPADVACPGRQAVGHQAELHLVALFQAQAVEPLRREVDAALAALPEALDHRLDFAVGHFATPVRNIEGSIRGTPLPPGRGTPLHPGIRGSWGIPPDAPAGCGAGYYKRHS